MVSNEKMKKRLELKKESRKSDSKFEKGAIYCSECGFKNSENSSFCAECGTKLISKSDVGKIIQKDIDIADPQNVIKCPLCRSKNYKNQTTCINCGKDLTETLGFFEGGTNKWVWKMDKDLEITADELIFYPRIRGIEKRKKKAKKYYLEDIGDIEVGKSLKQLRFYYNGKLKMYDILPEHIDEIERLLMSEEFNHQRILGTAPSETTISSNSITSETIVPEHVKNEYEPKHSGNTTLIDINNASEEEIASLPGVGIILAKKAVNMRKSNNGFNSFEEFSMGLGLKPHIAKRLESQVICTPVKKQEDNEFSGRIVDI